MSSAPMPTLYTERLTLRPFAPCDAETVQRLAGDRRVADTTLTIPHPYEDGAAETWIGTLAPQWEARTRLVLAITTEADGVMGGIGLHLAFEHRRAELGYWIGVPYWSRGYATEAGRAMVQLGFGDLELNRIEAHHLRRNPASGRVLGKLGMSVEGVRRQHIVKWGVPEDIVFCAALASDVTVERARADA